MLSEVYIHPKDPDADERPDYHSRDSVRAEHTIVDQGEREWRAIVLDADDTFDVIIHYPNGDRECLFSVVKS